MFQLKVFLFAASILVSIGKKECDAAVQKVKSGGMYFNTTFQGEYSLTGNIKIAKDVVLTVLPGAHIMGNGFKVRIDGQVMILGSNEDPVIVEDTHFVAGRGDAGHLEIRGAALEGGSVYSIKNFKGLKASVNISDSTLSNMDSMYLFYPPRNMSIVRSVFDRCGGISAGSDAVQIEISNNLFHKQTTDFAIKNWARMPWVISQEESEDGKNYYYALDMVVSGNTFTCTDRVALKLEPGYTDALMQKSQNNYFSTTDKDEIISNMLHDKRTNKKVHNKIQFLPFLDSPHKDTPRRPDFQC
jgi:hypothetical protein